MTETLSCPLCGDSLDICDCSSCKYCDQFSVESDKREAWNGFGATKYCKHCESEVERNARHSQLNGEIML